MVEETRLRKAQIIAQIANHRLVDPDVIVMAEKMISKSITRFWIWYLFRAKGAPNELRIRSAVNIIEFVTFTQLDTQVTVYQISLYFPLNALRVILSRGL